MKISIFDVAKKAGVSVVTVSRVLNDFPSVREKNRQKVLQAIKELDYRPNSAARSLAMGKTGVIGLTLTTLQDTLFDGIIKSVNDALKEHGYFLALSIEPETAETAKGESSNFLYQEDRVDGIILLSPLNEERDVLELKRKKIPFVLVDNQLEDTGASVVNVDNYMGGLTATRHLLGLGHTRIAHVCGPALYRSAKERKRGYMDAMAEAGLAPYLMVDSDFNIRDGYEIAKSWLAGGECPTAVFAADDFIALGIVEAFRDAGRHVPQELSVIGYDDQAFSADIHPRLTTIRQPTEGMAQEAVKLLLRIKSGAQRRNASIKLEPELIVRESTAVCRT
ncbi:LacI family DNA-binding transcriptional regulator [Paenibacillus lutrae]|uniref:LacI family DNA-binding transcriptional regulator n=1 Tax=Paenibacillus lutrae TaxID=2078573 RepID=A0A7X3JZ38_9BACL|nr:LacI family DNA-binding transcriptional regulator [Paenibacillus lutrae]MVO99783.1 LacI family DNA-binding transcriptional regulator [Paenibacillus lutrae]